MSGEKKLRESLVRFFQDIDHREGISYPYVFTVKDLQEYELDPRKPVIVLSKDKAVILDPMEGNQHYYATLLTYENGDVRLSPPEEHSYGFIKKARLDDSDDVVASELSYLKKAGLAAEENTILRIGESRFIPMQKLGNGQDLGSLVEQEHTEAWEALSVLSLAIKKIDEMKSRGIIQLDLQAQNIICPCGSIIDLEFVALEDEQGWYIPLVLEDLDDSIESLDEDLDIPCTLLVGDIESNTVRVIDVDELIRVVVKNLFSSIINQIQSQEHELSIRLKQIAKPLLTDGVDAKEAISQVLENIQQSLQDHIQANKQ